MRVVDQAGGQELADGGRAAADADVPARGGLARPRQRLRGAGVEEVKRGTAVHPDGGPEMVGEHKDRGVERRGVSPPSVPLLVRPGSTVRAELAPAHDLGADARGPSAGEDVVDAGAAAGLALHRAEGTSGEEPLVQPGSRMPERSLQALPRAGAEPIQRHREVVHPDLRHDDLLTSCFTATGTSCRGPPPVRTMRWPKVIASAWPPSIIPVDHRAFLLTARNWPWTQDKASIAAVVASISARWRVRRGSTEWLIGSRLGVNKPALSPTPGSMTVRACLGCLIARGALVARVCCRRRGLRGRPIAPSCRRRLAPRPPCWPGRNPPQAGTIRGAAPARSSAAAR